MICAFCVFRHSPLSGVTKRILPYDLLTVLKFYLLAMRINAPGTELYVQCELETYFIFFPLWD